MLEKNIYLCAMYLPGWWDYGFLLSFFILFHKVWVLTITECCFSINYIRKKGYKLLTKLIHHLLIINLVKIKNKKRIPQICEGAMQVYSGSTFPGVG